MTRIVIIAILMVFSSRLVAVGPPFDYSGKTTGELVELLKSNEPKERACAASFLGLRYGDTNAPRMDVSRVGPPELPMPHIVVSQLENSLVTDGDSGVRICAIYALGELKFRTNTTQVILRALMDKELIVRIRACTVLFETANRFKEPMPQEVIPTLVKCLDANGDVEIIWQAAYAAEELGTKGKALMPALDALKKHSSSKVRFHAKKAIKAIEAKG